MVKGYRIVRRVTQPDRTGRARAEKLHPGEPCEVCAMPYGGRGRVQRHHVDGNRMNNSRSNIAFLCVKHHKDAHKATDGAVGGGPRPRIASMMRDRAREMALLAVWMRIAGASVDEVADYFGVHRSSVLRWFRKYHDAIA